MSATPFRSHLLQQWARSSQSRPPVAIVPWLKSSSQQPSSSTLSCQPSQVGDYSEGELGTSTTSVGSHSRRHPQHRRHPPPRHQHHHHHAPPRRPHHRTSSTNTNTSAGSQVAPPSLSSIDTTPSSLASSPPSSPSSTPSSSPCLSPASSSLQKRLLSTSTVRSSISTLPLKEEENEYDQENEEEETGDNSIEETRVQRPHVDYDNDGNNNGLYDSEDSEASSSMGISLATSFQSLLLSRHTATRLTLGTQCEEDEQQQQQLAVLKQAMDRAVACGQMAPNHKRTEPYTFQRFISSSHTALQLAEIAYHVTLRKTNSIPNAQSKRQKWLDIPAFLVTLVHDNQNEQELLENEVDETGNDKSSSSSSSLYQALPYMPPTTERQLEDYAAACAAIQNVLLSLHADGIGSKWATGPVIQTPAFRHLIHAQPTDRVAGLIMVGALDSSTSFTKSPREEYLTRVRRTRRRSLHGDVLVDLP